MGSDNLVSAGNQQERLSSEERLHWFLAGVVEGEGSVHLALKAHPTMRLGYYVQPAFFVYQHRERRALLEMAQEYLGAGRIHPKSGNPDVLVFSVMSRESIVRSVVPFLESCQELSARWEDYAKFIAAVRLLEQGVHRTPDGLSGIVRLAYSMNANGKQRRIPIDVILGRILRGHTPNTR